MRALLHIEKDLLELGFERIGSLKEINTNESPTYYYNKDTNRKIGIGLSVIRNIYKKFDINSKRETIFNLNLDPILILTENQKDYYLPNYLSQLDNKEVKEYFDYNTGIISSDITDKYYNEFSKKHNIPVEILKSNYAIHS